MLPKIRLPQTVAVALQVGTALQEQVFYVRRQLEMGCREDRVDAFARRSRSLIAAIVDEVEVVAGPTEHDVGPASPSRRLLPVLPVMRVGLGCCRSLQIGAPQQGQVFDVRRQPQMRRRIDGIDALIGVLDDQIAGMVDDVGVVAEATDQPSAPAPPSSVSLPPRPTSTLTPALPVMTLASSLPKPRNAAPVRVRFSRLAPSV